MVKDKESGYGAKKILLLKDQEYAAKQAREMTKNVVITILENGYIHRFNQQGIDGVISRKHIHKQ